MVRTRNREATADTPIPLQPCPDSPNCVSTLATDNTHAIAPIPFSGKVKHARERLARIVRQLPRCTIVQNKGNRLRLEFRSRIFRFVDDVDFFFDAHDHKIHFRAAARMGRSDLGVNRRRMEKIRQLFQQS